MKETELDLLLRGVEEIIPKKDFLEKLNLKRPESMDIGSGINQSKIQEIQLHIVLTWLIMVLVKS